MQNKQQYVYAIVMTTVFLLSTRLVMAQELTQEDIVGNILNENGVDRNPAETNSSIVGGHEEGKISGFGEGPVVISEGPIVVTGSNPNEQIAELNSVLNDSK